MSQENIDNSIEEQKKNTRTRRAIPPVSRPLTAYFLFCKDKRAEFGKQDDGKKLTPKTLGKMWRDLSSQKKKVYIDKYKSLKKSYDEIIERLKQDKKKEDDEEETEIESSKKSTEEKPQKKTRKIKAKIRKEDEDKSNMIACNCGNCDECKVKKKKNKK